MGTSFVIVLYAPDEATANRGFAAAFQRIAELDSRLSDYNTESELSRLCQQAPMAEPTHVSSDLVRVLAAADEVSRRTAGAFDVTVGPLTRLWRRARRRKEFPPADEWAAARAAVGFQKVEIDTTRQTVRLTAPAMRLDLGGIAKGFALDEALATLRAASIERALVNSGGGIAVSAPPPGKDHWLVALAPVDPQAKPTEYLALTRQSVATSGDAFQFVELDGQRYSHILDPRSGTPLIQRMSVHVIAPTGTAADAWSTALSVLGHPAGDEVLASMPEIAARWVLVRDERQEVHESAAFRQFVCPPPVAADEAGGFSPQEAPPQEAAAGVIQRKD